MPYELKLYMAITDTSLPCMGSERGTFRTDIYHPCYLLYGGRCVACKPAYHLPGSRSNLSGYQSRKYSCVGHVTDNDPSPIAYFFHLFTETGDWIVSGTTSQIPKTYHPPSTHFSPLSTHMKHFPRVATVAEWLNCSPPTKTNRVHSILNFRKVEIVPDDVTGQSDVTAQVVPSVVRAEVSLQSEVRGCGHAAVARLVSVPHRIPVSLPRDKQLRRTIHVFAPASQHSRTECSLTSKVGKIGSTELCSVITECFSIKYTFVYISANVREILTVCALDAFRNVDSYHGRAGKIFTIPTSSLHSYVVNLGTISYIVFSFRELKIKNVTRHMRCAGTTPADRSGVHSHVQMENILSIKSRPFTLPRPKIGAAPHMNFYGLSSGGKVTNGYIIMVFASFRSTKGQRPPFKLNAGRSQSVSIVVRDRAQTLGRRDSRSNCGLRIISSMPVFKNVTGDVDTARHTSISKHGNRRTNYFT
ncbi:hypothetical protein PR048_014700 [Dryococelus australis]|uniref:Uncharacterized protein n=1 Tax=Dryococelus australis TaxID=614101 RepID=A0ABQ9HFR7_9NEOP|nr:hypothetical protein PR048_014700 [Dryococelus australis]